MPCYHPVLAVSVGVGYGRCMCSDIIYSLSVTALITSSVYCCCFSANAQSAEGSTVHCSADYVSAQEHFLESVSHQNVCDLQGALEYLTKAHLLEPTNAQFVTFASKQWTDHTYVPGIQREEVIRCNNRAIALAKVAQKLDSSYSLAWSAECIGKGRLATFERNPKRILQLAKEAQEAAYKALEADSHDDVAHHLMGRWHVGMASLNAVVRTLIKYVFGTEFRPGTMAQALECYQQAATLRPDRVIHRVELAKTLLQFAQEEDAIRELKVLPFSSPHLQYSSPSALFVCCCAAFCYDVRK